VTALRRLMVSSVLFGVLAISASAANAAVTNCIGPGSTPTGVSAAKCNTDMNGGSGSVAFRNSFQTVQLTAKTQRGGDQVAASWDQYLFGNTSGNVCVKVSIRALSLKASGPVTLQLATADTTATYPGPPHLVTTTRKYKLCSPLPLGSVVSWELLITAGGVKPVGNASVKMTLVGVSYF
jgi:hypothetical protein